MGGEQAAQVLSQIKLDKMAKDKQEWPEASQASFKNQLRQQYETQGHPLYASARLWDDGIIMPSDTRKVLGYSLKICMNAPFPESQFGVWRM